MLKHFNSHKLSDNHPLTYSFLAFIAMVGLSYINFLPGLINALAGGIGFNESEAGQIVAFNGYGGLLGSTMAIFLVRRIHWQPVMFSFLVLLTVIDIATIWIDAYNIMLGWRFIAGVLGGLCVGIGFAVLARLKNPDRAFGTLLFVQFGIGSIIIYALPDIEAQFGPYAVFGVMASLMMLSLILLPFIPNLRQDNSSSHQQSAPTFTSFPRSCLNVLLLMFAIIAYQVAASAIWAYVGLIGLEAKMSNQDVSMYIATTGLLGILGAMFPIISGNRFGRLYWVSAGMVMSVTAALLLSTPQLTAQLYVGAMSLLFFAWPAVLSYLLAVTAEFDVSGKLSTVAAVVSSIGLATGPLIASSLLEETNFSLMLNACAAILLLSFILLFKPIKALEKEHQGTLPARSPS